MIGSLKPYPEYKESGLPWLGKVPTHWQDGPGFAAFRKKKVRNIGLQERTVLSLSYGRIIVKAAEKLHGLVPESFETYQIVGPGDIIIRCTDLQNDWTSLRVGLVKNRGIITSAYLCLRTTESVLPEYGYLLLHAFDLMKVFYGLGSGLRQNLDFSDLKRMVVFVPPPEEQAAIVRFLNDANGKIERAIRTQRKLMEMLSEQKHAIIERAVTRGVDPTVPLKPSNIRWLGKVPKHWEVRRLKHCITSPEQGWSPQCDALPAAENEWGVLKVGCVNKDSFAAQQNKKLPEYLTPDPSLEIRDDDILISRANTRELLGLAALAENPRPKLILCDKLFRFRAHKECFNPKFLVLCLRAQASRVQIESSTNGASDSMQNIGRDVVRNLWVSMPGPDEQEEILAYIEAETRPVRSAISRLEREIAFLQEYRTRLTADVVSGKLDVRAVVGPPATEVEEPWTSINAGDLMDEAEFEPDAIGEET